MNWVLVHTAQGNAEAMVIKSMLEANGIDVKEAKERLELVEADGLGDVEIFVLKERAEEATKLIEEEFKESTSTGPEVF